MNQVRHQQGMSLVEVMVALVISLFLLGGIIQVFLSTKVSYSFSNAVSGIQENGRFSLDTIAQDTRMIGTFGCVIYDPDNTDAIVNNINPAGNGYNPLLHDFLGQGLLDGTDNDGFNDSDSITIRGTKAGQVNVAGPFGSVTDPIKITNQQIFQAGDMVMVSNCEGADIFQVSDTTTDTVSHELLVPGSPGNHSPAGGCSPGEHCLSRSYEAGASMFELQTVTYSIEASSDGSETPTLMRSDNGVNQELVEDVEQLQVLYGLDTDGNSYADQYVVSTAVADMKDVMSVRIMLLVRSNADFIVEGGQSYFYNGVQTRATDRRLRQVFSTTIALRNRAGAE